LITNIDSHCLNSVDEAVTIQWKVFSRENNSKVEGKVGLAPATTRAGWSVGSLPPGKYAIYLNIYLHSRTLLYQGMIRYFEVGGPPAECGNLHNIPVDEKPTNPSDLCKSGEPSTVSENSDWTYSWTCSGSDIVSCQAYRNAQCNPTFNHQYMSAEPTGNLCSTGDKLAELSFDGAKWSWNCKANESEASCETYKNLNCRLQPSQGSICPDDDLEVAVEDLVPPKENERLKEVSWDIPGVGSESGDKNSPICESFSPDFTQAPSGTHSINYTVSDIDNQEAGCFTSVYVKEPSCSIILDSPSTEMSVGSTLKLTIKKECITPAVENPYALQVLLQGTNDADSYEFSQGDLNDDGTVDIKIKKAGNFTFKAAVNGENGSVSCSSQISAFTEGSEWWERKPE